MLCRVAGRTLPLTRSIHNRHFPNDSVKVDMPRPQDYEEVKHKDGKSWPFFGGRVRVERRRVTRFPQVTPIVDSTPVDIRPRQLDKTMRFGGNPRTYPTMLVYPDGSTITVPYHKPVGTLYLPGDGTKITIGPKTKTRTKRRIKVGI